MAKTDSRAPQHARPLGRFRKRVVSFYRRDGTRIVRSWPVKRPGEPAPIVKAWQEDLPFTRRAIASMSQCTTKFIEPWLPRSGYTMWDWLNAMFHGRGLRHIYPGQKPNMLPYLFRNPPDKKWEGAPRVLTPIAQIHRAAAEALTANVMKTLTLNVEDWDTNDFWRSTPTPERLTVRAAGLYLFYADAEYSGGGAYNVHMHIEHSDGTWIGGQNGSTASGWNAWTNIFGLRYMNPNEYVVLRTITNGSGKSVKTNAFGCVAITPETIF